MSDIRDSAIRTLDVLCQPALSFSFLIQRRYHLGKLVSRMQCRQLREEWFYAVLVSGKIWGRSSIFSHCLQSLRKQTITGGGIFRQPQAKEKSRKSTTRAPISLTTTQSHHPHVLQKHLFQVKQSCRLCVWLCHSDASGKQVCVEYHGVPNATPSPSSFMSKAQPIKQKRERGTVHRLQ